MSNSSSEMPEPQYYIASNPSVFVDPAIAKETERLVSQITSEAVKAREDAALQAVLNVFKKDKNRANDKCARYIREIEGRIGDITPIERMALAQHFMAGYLAAFTYEPKAENCSCAPAQAVQS